MTTKSSPKHLMKRKYSGHLKSQTISKEPKPKRRKRPNSPPTKNYRRLFCHPLVIAVVLILVTFSRYMTWTKKWTAWDTARVGQCETCKQARETRSENSFCISTPLPLLKYLSFQIATDTEFYLMQFIPPQSESPEYPTVCCFKVISIPTHQWGFQLARIQAAPIHVVYPAPKGSKQSRQVLPYMLSF